MPNNNDDESVEQDFLSNVLDDYAAWYSRVLRAAYYPGEESPDIAVNPPGTFEQWYEQTFADIEDNAALEDLRQQYDALISATSAIVDESQVQKPSIHTFDRLRQNFEVFLARLRRIDYDRLSGDFGIDALTGLRSNKVMPAELAKEMERRARRGMPFTLVLVHIDNYACLQDKLGTDVRHEVIQKSAEAMKTIMRTVDDAYRLTEHQFLINLKHSDMDGAVRFSERAKQHLTDMDVRFNYDDKQIPLTLSFCSGEPLPDDDINFIISELQKDLEAHYKGPGTSIVYEDAAPIERYVKSIQRE